MLGLFFIHSFSENLTVFVRTACNAADPSLNLVPRKNNIIPLQAGRGAKRGEDVAAPLKKRCNVIPYL